MVWTARVARIRLCGVEANTPLASDILKSLQANFRTPTAPDSLPPQMVTVGKPSFGSIYFGNLPCFAFGKPHFAMVQSKDETFWGHSVAMSPITTRQQDVNSEEYCLQVPPGILPTPDWRGFKLQRVSWVLLPIILRVPLQHVRNSMRWELRLPENLQDEAESKLLKIR
jgi:hypothetical protein